MTDYKIDLAGIKSMRDLKEARARIKNTIDLKEMELRHDLDSIKDKFSWENIIGSVTTKVVWPRMTRGFKNGCKIVNLMMNSFKYRYYEYRRHEYRHHEDEERC